MHNKEFIDLLQKYANGLCTDEERALVETWYLREEEHPLKFPIEDLNNDLDRIGANLRAHTRKPKQLIRKWYGIAAAAAIIGFVSYTAYFVIQKNKSQATNMAVHDIAPATQIATLTLSNGRQIKLTKSLSGKLAQQGNTAIHITGKAALAYSRNSDAHSTPLEYNTLSTVRGELSPYFLILSDGTKVWLNAASSITFPVSFNNAERLVKITGEAYFEVAHNPAKPFLVSCKNYIIEDKGTHFNIDAYEDEPATKVTLLEGAVSIQGHNHKYLLKPGQQAITETSSDITKIKEVDAEDAIAWKKGYFLFENESLQSVMRKISRWYNVAVEYPSGDKVIANYWGTISMESNISVVLKKIEATNNVRFKVIQNKVLVFKK